MRKYRTVPTSAIHFVEAYATLQPIDHPGLLRVQYQDESVERAFWGPQVAGARRGESSCQQQLWSRHRVKADAGLAYACLTIAGCLMGTHRVGVDGRCVIRKGLSTNIAAASCQAAQPSWREGRHCFEKVGPLLRANHEARYMCEILVFEYLSAVWCPRLPHGLSLELGVYKSGDDAEDRDPAIIVLQNAGVRDG